MPSQRPLEIRAIGVVDDWYGALDAYRDKLPSKGSIGAALVVLDRLILEYDLSIESHVSDKEAQIAGLSRGSVAKVLAQFGETRTLSAIGGRSNRGARGDVSKLLKAMQSLNLEGESPDVRRGVLVAMQEHIVLELVPRFFSVKRVKAPYDRACSTWAFIHALLDDAQQNGKGGPVAEHLVGAKLALRFPEIPIRNKSSSEADDQGGFAGDFEVGETVFHVTLAPMPELFEKIKRNLDSGRRVYILVGNAQLEWARQQADHHARCRIAVGTIETFVSTNIDELAEFGGDQLIQGLHRLLLKYNERVEAVELDKSLLIEIPQNISPE